MKFLKVTTILVASALLCSCFSSIKSSVVDVPPLAFNDSATGVVILSTRAPGQCKLTASWLTVYETNSGKLVDNAPMIPIDILDKSDFTTHYGAVHAIQLSPGNYYLSLSYANPAIETRKAPAFGFAVKGGETVYLGEVQQTAGCASKGSFFLNDQYTRDVQAAIEKNPAVASRVPVKRILSVLSR